MLVLFFKNNKLFFYIFAIILLFCLLIYHYLQCRKRGTKKYDKKNKALNNAHVEENINFILSYFAKLKSLNKKDNIIAASIPNTIKVVKLPKNVDEMEWIAYNAYMFFGCVNTLYSILEKMCSQITCPHIIPYPILYFSLFYTSS